MDNSLEKPCLLLALTNSLPPPLSPAFLLRKIHPLPSATPAASRAHQRKTSSSRSRS